MKQLYVSLFALALIFASFTAPALANGNATGKNFTVTMQNFPDVVSPGDTVSGEIVVALGGEFDPNARRHRARFEVFITTPLGPAPIQSGTFGIQPGTSRTFKLDIPVSPDAKSGLYTMKFVLTLDGQTVDVGHELIVK